MTTLTREQVVQWADESVFDIVKADCYHEFDEVADSGNLWITKRLTDFATIARADLEATVKKQAAEIERLSERRCEICGYAEHHREHTGCLRQQLAASQAKDRSR